MGPSRPRKTVTDGFEAELAGPPSWPMRPQHIMHELRAVLRHDDVVVCDVGAHKLWMARMFPCETPNSCIVSNGFAAMGIGRAGRDSGEALVSAAPLSLPSRATEDSSMNSQELETAVRLKLPLVILIWRDNGYGVIRWKQQVRFGRTSSVDFGNPDFVRYAESFGAAGYRVTAPTELRPILEQALQLRRAGCDRLSGR